MAEVKNKKKGSSEASDEQKTEKNSFPTPRMSKKLKKMAFRGLGRTKNWEKQLSDPSDEQKTGKTGFPTPWMNKKLEKTAFQPLG